MSMIEPRPAEKRGCWAANWERDAVLLLDCAALPPLAGFADKPQPMMKKPRGSRRGAWGCLLSTCRPPFPGILRLPTQMCTSLRIPSAAGILRDFGVRVRSSDLP